MLVAELLACSCGPGPGAVPPDRREPTADTASPTGDTAPALRWEWVGGGGGGGCGLRSDARAFCWAGTQPPMDVRFTQIDLGTLAACGIDIAGEVHCWCDEASDSLCDHEPPRGPFVAVRTGSYIACAERPDGRLRCWGHRDPRPPDAPVAAFDVGSNHACAVLLDGRVTCFGGGLDEAPPEGSRFVAVQVGQTFACGLTDAAEIRCWGRSSDGESPFPQGPVGPWVDLRAGVWTVCGLREDRTAQCWFDPSWRVFVVPKVAWSSLDLGYTVSCGITVDGRALCFDEEHGDNSWQVYGTPDPYEVPDPASFGP